jgi:peptidyl-tRNA hydrolase
LYIITREDISSGYQGVQSIHAAIQFGIEHYETHKEWYEKSNYLGFLSVSNEEELIRLANKATMLEIKCSMFREPDLDNQVTAIAIAPGKRSKKLCSNLKLALKEEYKMSAVKL